MVILNFAIVADTTIIMHYLLSHSLLFFIPFNKYENGKDIVIKR